MLGIALGVAALIVVLSVMNGFQHELRDRILGVVSHVQIQGANSSVENWPQLERQVKTIIPIVGVAPYSSTQGLLSKDDAVRGVMVRGVFPKKEKQVSAVGKQMIAGNLDSLVDEKFNIILGSELARMLGAELKDKVLLMIPKGQLTPAGVIPRLKMFTVSGVFDSGMYDYDASLALVHLRDVQKLTRSLSGVDGLRIKIKNLFAAPAVNQKISENIEFQNVYVTDWTQSHSSFFRAVQIEKRVMFIILMLVVAVAAFNIVSTLVMAVADKRSDIAILRTLGSSPNQIMLIFMIQGALIGIIGTLIGASLGVTIALNIDVIVPFVESFLGVDLLSKDVYYISDLPSELKFNDVIVTVAVSFFLSISATIYPSWRASKTRPAEALRYE